MAVEGGADYRQKLAKRQAERNKGFSKPAPKNKSYIRKGLGWAAKRYNPTNIIPAAYRTVRDTVTDGPSSMRGKELVDPRIAPFVFGPMSSQASNILAGNFLNNPDFDQATAPLDLLGISGLAKGGAALAAKKGVKPAVASIAALDLSGLVKSEEAEAARASGAKKIIKVGLESSKIRNQVENALGDPAGGAVRGLSKFATNLISLGIPLDKQVVENVLDPDSIKALGATRNMAFTGPYRVNLRLEPTQEQLNKRVGGLLTGTLERLKRSGTPELPNLKSEIEDLISAGDEVSSESLDILKRLEVPVDESLTALQALANRPTHLIDEWANFRADNPRTPFQLQRWSPNARGFLSMGPAGEHPLGVGGAERVGQASRWTSNPELNDLIFWLHYFPNILKGGESPAIWVPRFKQSLPGLADVVMPEGGYVDEAYKRAIENTDQLFPDYLKELARTQLDLLDADMGKPGRSRIIVPRKY